MDDNSLRLLEFHKIKDRLSEFAQSSLGKALIATMRPSLEAERIRLLLRETAEARVLVDQSSGGHPLSGLHDISESLDRVAKGGVLHPEDLALCQVVLEGAAKTKKYMRRNRSLAPMLCGYAESITELDAVVMEIENAIAGNVVADQASPALARTRSQIRVVEERIKTTLSSLVSSARLRDAIQDGFISQKSGHWVIAIKSSHKHVLPGAVITTSNTGSTVFIEPDTVRRHTEELRILEAQEEACVYQVLVSLTALVAENLAAIRVNLQALGAYDFIFARARYAAACSAVAAEVLDTQVIEIRAGRHPLLGPTAVPLDLQIGDRYRTLVITGPNTGGKTVVLKTVGLFCAMNQCGLHVPAACGTRLGVFREILADIGDSQSIENSLSTFSSHMGNICRMMKLASEATLVLIDEIGTGTDPAEGAALGCAVLMELSRLGAVCIVTTHYGDIKRFADTRPGFVNGCMEFDQTTLRPLYMLTIGKAGESQAFWIAQNLGFSESILGAARALVRRPGPPDSTVEAEPAVTSATPETDDPVSDTEKRDMTPGASRSPNRADQRPTPARFTTAGRATRDQAVSERPRNKQFLRGDCVFVHTTKARGVVAQEEDEYGNITVRVRGENLVVNHKRVSMIGLREDLYPGEDYDLDIVLLSKEDRKLSHLMNRKLTDKVRVIEPESNKHG